MGVDIKDVQQTVKSVESIDHKAGDGGGASAAYQELKTQFDDYAKKHSAEDTKEYWQGVTKQLAADKVLPDLSIAWGKGESIDGESAHGIKSPYKNSADTPQGNFDRTMANTLADNIKQVDTTGTFWGNSDNKISAKELDNYLEAQSKTNQKNAELQVVRDQQAPLFKGAPSLASTLDGLSDKGKRDGTIMRNDMQKFCDNYDSQLEQNPNFSNGVYTKENRAYVQNILDGGNPAVSENGNSFSVAGVAQKGGFKVDAITKPEDYNSVVENFNSVQPKVEPEPDMNVPKTSDTDVPSKTADTDETKSTAAFLETHKTAVTQQPKEGPYMAAANILGKGATSEDVHALAKALKEDWQEKHNDKDHKNNKMSGLESGYKWLNADNFTAILAKSKALQDKYNQSKESKEPTE